MVAPAPLVPFRTALRVWGDIGIHSFGGPAAQIGYMHKVLVEERRWISERRFLHALNYCMLLPGPEAMQLATYVGWLLHGIRGGLVAGAFFVLPGFVAILGLSLAYAHFQDTTWIETLFFGLKAAVLAVVLEAVIRIGKRALHNAVLISVAAAAFIAIFFLDIPFPLIVLGAGIFGYLAGRHRPSIFALPPPKIDAEATGPVLLPDQALPRERPDRAASARTLVVWLLIWWVPVLALVAAYGVSNIFVQEAWFFSKAAVVTFGGAYAVLAYVAQRAVEDFAWLRPGEMLDGLGMAESTPGPLIMVLQFVGFMGAFRSPGAFDPLVAGILASVVVTWVTFVPCFLWIFLGAPYIEHLRGRAGLNHALGAITAAVVGVILNLAVWFGIHVLFPGAEERVYLNILHVLTPVGFAVDWAALAIAIGAFVALLRWKWGMMPTLGAAMLLGVGYQLALA